MAERKRRIILNPYQTFLFIKRTLIISAEEKEQNIVVTSVESRKEPGMVEGFQSLLQLKAENKPNAQEILLDEGPNKQKCEEKKVIMEIEMILEDFEPRPSVTAYNDDNIHSKLKNKEFEPRPSVTAYNNDNIQSKLKNSGFEPRPSVTAYNNDNANVMIKNNEFEPRPSVTAYNNDNIHSKLKKSEFEPRPSVTTYNKEFEPIPSVTKYND
ncbi:hypothetical protein Ahy_A03g016548 isoform C [Arachis hypogaea]|uniref:Uncharacterized protein n=1 Tax=Arachis hypogaea TaxID=3818 RepID=A0A445E3V1_ARAHY|nr:hypothetical protein Ahy_A03g016548 isoform C [Arachis hypogaea]